MHAERLWRSTLHTGYVTAWRPVSDGRRPARTHDPPFYVCGSINGWRATWRAPFALAATPLAGADSGAGVPVCR